MSARGALQQEEPGGRTADLLIGGRPLCLLFVPKRDGLRESHFSCYGLMGVDIPSRHVRRSSSALPPQHPRA
ncbi:hypothetical protein EYF80_012318 [Liparis tanakae]|uniref:Uncharacterized protein n=1 Tax=Liparis tanakae TaxID=230148 RepID=A0A4Z2IJ77_9TELE|nr:hypothetical protein EYF80_012318 [Liparis tanakae]